MLVPELLVSRNRALIENNWYFGKRFGQYGHPFIWVDGDAEVSVHPTLSLLQHFSSWFSTYYETYEWPVSLAGELSDEVEKAVKEEFRTLTTFFGIHKVFSAADYETYLTCHSRSRAIDIRILQLRAPDLNLSRMFHLDFGPGMGGHALWNSIFREKDFLEKEKRGGKGIYLGAEINDSNYALQRSVLSYLAIRNQSEHVDTLALESMGVLPLTKASLDLPSGSFAQIPSWHLGLVPQESVDLITATTVLNEISHSGIAYFAEQVLRTLKLGGFLYVKDSAKVKPGRHNIDWEAFLLSVGFIEITNLDGLRHRENIHGIPRLYKKTSSNLVTFDSIMDQFVGNNAMTLHGGSMVQNISSHFSDKI